MQRKASKRTPIGAANRAKAPPRARVTTARKRSEPAARKGADGGTKRAAKTVPPAARKEADVGTKRAAKTVPPAARKGADAGTKRAAKTVPPAARKKASGWGGWRPGAGRKPADPNAPPRVAHTKRPVPNGGGPVHVTLKAHDSLPSLREPRLRTMLTEVLQDQRRRHYDEHFRVIDYSIADHELRLVIQLDQSGARDYEPLRSGMSGLAIAFARRLNMMLGRKGKVWADRYEIAT